MDTETMLNVLQDKKVKRLETELEQERAALLSAAGVIGSLSANLDELRVMMHGIQYIYNSYQLGDFTELETIKHMVDLARKAHPLP